MSCSVETKLAYGVIHHGLFRSIAMEPFLYELLGVLKASLISLKQEILPPELLLPLLDSYEPRQKSGRKSQTPTVHDDHIDSS